MKQLLARLKRLVPRTRSRRIVLGLCLLGLVLVVIVVKILNAPSQGHIIAAKDHLTTQKRTVTKATPPATTVDNSYFSLALPPGYNPQTPATVSGLLYSQTLTKPGAMGSLIITISIKQLNADGLSGDSSYHLRETQADRFKLSQQTIGGDIVHIANDQQSAAIVAFWPHVGYLATISISSGIGNPSTDDNADELKALQPLLAAWQWR